MKTLINLSLTITLLFAFSVSTVLAQQTIEITGTDNMKFDVTSIEAAPGEEITIIYTTKSNMPKQAMAHNVVVMDKDADVQGFITASASAKDSEYIAPGFEDQIIAAAALAGGGETVEVTFTAPETAGDYEYVCSFPGHYYGGMKGILTVS